jgi:hypothetical protein
MPVYLGALRAHLPATLDDIPFDRPARVFFELKHPILDLADKSVMSASFLGINFL